jgi:hypothetical protein
VVLRTNLSVRKQLQQQTETINKKQRLRRQHWRPSVHQSEKQHRSLVRAGRWLLDDYAATVTLTGGPSLNLGGKNASSILALVKGRKNSNYRTEILYNIDQRSHIPHIPNPPPQTHHPKRTILNPRTYIPLNFIPKPYLTSQTHHPKPTTLNAPPKNHTPTFLSIAPMQ